MPTHGVKPIDCHQRLTDDRVFGSPCSRNPLTVDGVDLLKSVDLKPDCTPGRPSFLTQSRILRLYAKKAFSETFEVQGGNEA